MIIILAILSTIIVGVLGAGLSAEWVNLGGVFAIATMGGFILYAIKKNNKSNPPE